MKHPTGGGSDSTRTYHYDNASWRDLLTSITIDGTTKSISYPHDIRGNITAGTPLSWYNGNEFTLTWGKGTQLASAKKGLALKTSYTAPQKILCKRFSTKSRISHNPCA